MEPSRHALWQAWPGVIVGLAAGLMLATAWHAGSAGNACLAALLVAPIAAATCAALRPGHRGAPPQEHRALDPSSRLLAQMHHELRTPLNAVIGFSEVMLRELHGPLGNPRYQEYAAHISASGGRLLKASEDALAVAETMSVLLAERHTPQRRRQSAARLLEQSWAALGPSAADVRLSVDDRAGVEIACDGRATSHALRHLLAEAASRAMPGGAVIARSGGDGRERWVELAAVPSSRATEGGPAQRPAAPGASEAGGDGLRLLLARSLIEMQGAVLRLGGGRAGRWQARIAFPGTPARLATGRRTMGAGARRTPGPASARPRDFAAGAAARASAGSCAAPRA